MALRVFQALFPFRYLLRAVHVSFLFLELRLALLQVFIHALDCFFDLLPELFRKLVQLLFAQPFTVLGALPYGSRIRSLLRLRTGMLCRINFSAESHRKALQNLIENHICLYRSLFSFNAPILSPGRLSKRYRRETRDSGYRFVPCCSTHTIPPFITVRRGGGPPLLFNQSSHRCLCEAN